VEAEEKRGGGENFRSWVVGGELRHFCVCYVCHTLLE